MPASSLGTFYDAAVYGAASSNLAEPDAVDAMEVGSAPDGPDRSELPVIG